MTGGWERLVAAGVARRGVVLAGHTTYKLGGPARLFVDASDLITLEQVAEALAAEPLPVLVLGRGSNLLVAEGGFDGVVVRLAGGFSSFRIDDDGAAVAGGGVTLPRLARGVVEAGVGGLEWGVGVPGTVGGAVRQNAGCFGSEVVDRLLEVEMVSLAAGTSAWRKAADLDLSYRHSNIASTDVVVTARFETEPVDPAEARAGMLEVTRWRREHQPGGTLNAGSVFKNPPHEPAAAIIDRLGLKGFTVGSVRVSPRHANFVEADSGSSPADVRALIEAVRARVREATGIALEREIQFVGFPESDT